MNVTEIVIEGTLQADGTLEPKQKPNLPPGRVTVRVQPKTGLRSSRGRHRTQLRTVLDERLQLSRCTAIPVEVLT
jgi:hypothetical protein